MNAAAPAPPSVLAGLLAFWAEAGVDCLYLDEPADRLAQSARRLATSEPCAPPAASPPTEAASVARHDAEALTLARKAAAAAGDLAALEAAVEAFAWGGLKARAARTVFARGPQDAPVLLIGEGPGVQEDREGRPFVGRSGQLLDRMLAAAGLSGQVFITNTVFWRPAGDRTPSSVEQALCLPFLERAVALVRPRVLLLAGGASAKAMLRRSEGVLSLRGRWFDWTPEDGGDVIPALPMLHPAFLLRQPAAKAQAWRDILTLRAWLDRS